MKKLIGISLLIAGLAFSSTVHAQKIGHIAFDSLLKSMPESDSARKIGQAYYQQLENTIESMQKELQAKYQDYQQNQATYTGIVKQSKEQELNDLNQRMQSFQGQAQTSLQKFNDSITKPIIDKAKKAVAKVAKDHGYKYILDTSTGGIVLYYDDGDDIFNMVAAELGIKPKPAIKTKSSK